MSAATDYEQAKDRLGRCFGRGKESDYGVGRSIFFPVAGQYGISCAVDLREGYFSIDFELRHGGG